jgi:hypothetical protein
VVVRKEDIMAVIILPEMEGYTKAILNPILELFTDCGMRVIFNHCFLTSENVRDPSYTRLREMNYAPILPNSAYFICQFEEGTERGSSIPGVARDLTEEVEKSNSVFLELEKFLHYQSWTFPWDSAAQKDLVFYDKATNEIVGWYNKAANILWMADIGNYAETSLVNIKQVMQCVKQFKLSGKLPFIKITIGTDPEFEVLDSRGELVNADSLFHDPNKNRTIGTDGHSATGELRPQFASNPLKLARNIKRLIRKMNSSPVLDSKISVCAGGGTRVMTGGHIHFGISSMPDDLREALWKLVAVPVLRFQGKLRHSDGSKCKKNGGDIVRKQPHGVEWRTLPSFIVNEDMTIAVLCTTYAIVKSFFTSGPLTTLSKASYSKLALYPTYKEQIDSFVDMFVKLDGEAPMTLLENRDILREWKLSKLNKNPSVVVNCDDEKLGRYFTPLYISLKQPVRIKVTFGPNDHLCVSGIPEDVEIKFKAFSKRHFVKFESTSSSHLRSRNQEYLSALRGRTGGEEDQNVSDDIFISLPVTWLPQEDDVAQGLFHELKDLIKEAVLELDEEREV